MTNKKNLVDKLGELGLNKYEAEGYIALLKNPAISAYEISKKSGVPQSKVYETVKNLVAKGLVTAQGTKPVKYTALPVDEFLNRYQNRMEHSIGFLKENLKEIVNQPVIDYMWHIKGREEIINKSREIIKKAKNRLRIEIWSDELAALAGVLTQAEERGVNITLVSYGRSEVSLGTVYYHEMEGMDHNARQLGRWLTIIKDGEESLFGIFNNLENYAIWTQNKSFMLMAETFIKHDIYIAEIYSKFKQQLDREFGPNLKKLRDKIE